MNSDNKNGLAYFNGTACPIVYNELVDYKSMANDIIKNGLKSGYSIDDLKQIHLKQMVAMESLLTEICGDEPTTNDNIKKWCDTMEFSQVRVNMLWYSNVYILLKLKVIKNDENNGMLFCHKLK